VFLSTLVADKDQWTNVAMVKDSTSKTYTLYRNHESQSESYAAETTTDGGGLKIFGFQGNTSTAYLGGLDEIRVTFGVRSDDWMVLSYASGVDRLISYCELELRPTDTPTPDYTPTNTPTDTPTPTATPTVTPTPTNTPEYGCCDCDTDANCADPAVQPTPWTCPEDCDFVADAVCLEVP
jgi:hypothetical protein